MARPIQILTEREKALIITLYSLGKTDEQVAKVLGLNRKTFTNMLEANGITTAIKKNAKEEADNKVEKSLFERACGYEHDSEEIFCNTKTGEVTRVPVKKKYAPDPVSCIFWLKNRKPKEWREKMEVGGDKDNPLIVTVKYPDGFKG